MSDILQTIKTLTEINSPSGNAEKAIQYVKETVEDIGFSTELTNKGALIINVTGDNQEQQRCITAHVDTLGAMVKEIKEDGRLAIDLIGDFTLMPLKENTVRFKQRQATYIREQYVYMKLVCMYIKIIMKCLEI